MFDQFTSGFNSSSSSVISDNPVIWDGSTGVDALQIKSSSTTADGIELLANSMTTGNGIKVEVDALTTGKGLLIDSDATTGTITSGYGAYIECHSTVATTGACLGVSDGEAASTITPIKIVKNSSSGAALTVENGSVSQPITGENTATTCMAITLNSITKGGGKITGYNEDGTDYGLQFRAILGSDDPTDNVPAMLFRAYKTDGATSTFAVGNDETCYAFQNSTTGIMTMMGNGKITLGGLVPFNFAAGSVSTGAGTMATNNSPGAGATTWVAVQVNGTAGYIPVHYASA